MLPTAPAAMTLRVLLKTMIPPSRSAARSPPERRVCKASLASSRPARGILPVFGSEQGRGRDHCPVAEIVAAAQLRTHLGFGLAFRQLGAFPHREIGTARQQQAAHAAEPVAIACTGAIAGRLPEADHLRVIGGLEARPGGGAEIEEFRPVLLRRREPAKGIVALTGRWHGVGRTQRRCKRFALP